jgi:hypothetical protein
MILVIVAVQVHFQSQFHVNDVEFSNASEERGHGEVNKKLEIYKLNTRRGSPPLFVFFQRNIFRRRSRALFLMIEQHQGQDAPHDVGRDAPRKSPAECNTPGLQFLRVYMYHRAQYRQCQDPDLIDQKGHDGEEASHRTLTENF